MAKLILPAGTDVAEMALFATNAIPTHASPSREEASRLEAAGKLIRMPTGADGGYLLHLYVDEPVPPEIMRYCCEDDQLSGQFNPTGGSIAFGGMESVYKAFNPNAAIRSDVALPTGEYTYVAYRTEFPDELVQSDINEGLSASQRCFLAFPGAATLGAFFATGICLATQRYLLAVVIGIASFLSIGALVRSSGYRELQQRRAGCELKYPSIVIELRSNPTTSNAMG